MQRERAYEAAQTRIRTEFEVGLDIYQLRNIDLDLYLSIHVDDTCW
jgi:hypothetical protein